jgi:protein TonB
MSKPFPNQKVGRLLVILTLLVASWSMNTATAQKLSAEVSVLQKIESVDALSGFKFGQKDLYSGVSDEAKNLILRISKEFPDEVMVRNDQGMTGDEYELYIASIRPVLINGASKFENNKGNISLQIMELPENRYLFIKTFNKETEKLNSSEFLEYIKGIYAATGEQFHEVELNENKKSETRYVLVKPITKSETKTANGEVIEEVVEIIEVERLSDTPKNRSNKMGDVPFAIIDEVPIYPGCSGTNNEKKKCMQENISKFANENFNTSIASDMGLTGRQNISILFKIDETGKVTDIKSRGDSPEMKAEAVRVISLLPKMKPGMQGGKEVGVIYGLPIIFEAGETKKD